MAELPPVAPSIMRRTADGRTVLVGARDAAGILMFPAPPLAGGLEPVDLGGDGVLHAFTTIHTRPPFGLPQPYAVGYVDLDSVALRVFALLGGSGLRHGAPMRLFARAVGVGLDGNPCLRPMFEVVDDG